MVKEDMICLRVYCFSSLTNLVQNANRIDMLFIVTKFTPLFRASAPQHGLYFLLLKSSK
jgi:hypothetical protein